MVTNRTWAGALGGTAASGMSCPLVSGWMVVRPTGAGPFAEMCRAFRRDVEIAVIPESHAHAHEVGLHQSRAGSDVARRRPDDVVSVGRRDDLRPDHNREQYQRDTDDEPAVKPRRRSQPGGGRRGKLRHPAPSRCRLSLHNPRGVHKPRPLCPVVRLMTSTRRRSVDDEHKPAQPVTDCRRTMQPAAPRRPPPRVLEA
jgi:hypothetical protein